MKPLACIRNQASVPLGIIEEVLDEQGVEWRYVDAWNGADLPDLTEISGLLVLGGEMNADDLGGYPHLEPVRSLMREATDGGLPVLGICLGAQLLARSLGAEVHPAPIKEIGFVEVEAAGNGSKDSILEPFAPSARVFQFHEDTCTLPVGAELAFTGSDVEVQAFRVGERAYGVQFHFEVTTTEVAAWCDATPDLERTWGATKEGLLAQAETHLGRQQAAGREVARRFTDLLR